MVSGISVPGLWISLSLGFCFPLDNMNCSTAVSVVCVWFYDGMVVNIWSIVISIWMIVVWSCYYCLLFSWLNYCWKVVGMVWVSISVGVWVVVAKSITIISIGIEIVGISFGFRLGCSSSKKSENYEKFHDERCGRFSGRHG